MESKEETEERERDAEDVQRTMRVNNSLDHNRQRNKKTRGQGLVHDTSFQASISQKDPEIATLANSCSRY